MSHPHTFNELYRRIQARKVPFFLTFFVIVLLTYALLYALDFYPEPVTEPAEDEATTVAVTAMTEETVVTEPTPAVVNAPLPTKIIFDDLDREVTVLNPESRDVATLDEALLDGAVRHPDSADFSADGNMFILAHSSYLPNVLNKNFQAFNGIQELTWGDMVRVQSADTEYVYRVEKVYKATTDLVVPHTPGEARLTLATCNSFGAKEDRFMVEAELIETRAL